MTFHVVAAAQAVIGHGQQAIRIGREVNANDVGFLIDHMIDEAGVLMARTHYGPAATRAM